MLKFDEELTVKGGVVTATGPYDPSKEKIIELCAWVFQPDEDERNVCGATEMTNHHGNAHHLLRQKAGAEADPEGDAELKYFEDPSGNHHWKLPIGRVGDGDMRAGEAFAVAVAMIKDTVKDQQRVIWWGHPVMLKNDGTA